MNTVPQLVFFFLFGPGPQPREWCLPSQPDLENSSQTCLESCLFGNSRSCQIENQYWPSQPSWHFSIYIFSATMELFPGYFRTVISIGQRVTGDKWMNWIWHFEVGTPILCFFHFYAYFKNIIELGTGEMTQRLRALTFLAKDPVSNLSTCMAANNCP